MKILTRSFELQALVVNLSSDHASGDRVAFYRQTELDLLSAASKARLKDVISPVDDDIVSLEGDNNETPALDKLVRFQVAHQSVNLFRGRKQFFHITAKFRFSVFVYGYYRLQCSIHTSPIPVWYTVKLLRYGEIF